MQIDLANTLVHKVYFVYHAFFIIACKLGLPLLRRGVGEGFSVNGEGNTDKRVNHKMDFDFEFD